MRSIEPSCTTVFRAELPMLFPDDDVAKKVSESFMTLGEFLASREVLPTLPATALLHPHCHQNAIMGTAAEEQVLEQMGIRVERPEAGCCGLAGPFGFEAGENYEVSIAVGERNLLPKVRDADAQTVIVADGFSCKTQISNCTDGRALHTAQVIKLALDQVRGSIQRHPERDLPDLVAIPYPHWRTIALGMAALAATAALIQRQR